MAQNTDIGTLVMLLSPYTNNKLMGKGGPPTGEMDVYINNTPTPGGAANGTIQQIETEVDSTYAGEWTFKGQPHRLGRAARIRYRYPVTDGAPQNPAILYWVEDYMLIGFEDGGV
jgi:hypothetical protein